jgi:hypothetical protein
MFHVKHCRFSLLSPAMPGGRAPATPGGYAMA